MPENHDKEAPDHALVAACTLWQSGQAEGSSPLRAAARVLTETPHYFTATFIDDFEEAARRSEVLRRHAGVLLNRLSTAPSLTAAQWGELVGFPSTWAGRGTRGGPHGDQIRQSLASGRLSMPLWGVSLSPSVAASFGGQFTFEIAGPFPAIVATQHSAIKEDEMELITGGEYVVESVEDTAEAGVLARLEFIDVISPG